MNKPMVRISILYPNTPGARFDLRYYVETHMPMSIRLLSTHSGFRGVSVEEGLSGTTAGSPPAFVAMGDFLLLSVEDFVAAFTPHAEVLQSDMPTYTDISPVIQFNEVLITRQIEECGAQLAPSQQLLRCN
jgi:uncharacterized protein (TIGR02118 family)